MSGTSCDGLDLCLVQFEGFNKFKILKAHDEPYSNKWKEKLRKAHLLFGRELLLLGNEWSRWVAEIIRAHFDLREIDLISSHGHTVFHEPNNSFTYQMGSLDVLSAELSVNVIGDFRSLDVALGGQGAPLVPIGDHYLFNEYDVCLNLGGIANATLNVNSEKYTAGDIVPCNLVLNHLAQKLGKDFDEGGKIAESGTVNQELLDELNGNSFFKEPFPKSLGREWVDEHVLKHLVLNVEDAMRTYVEHISIQLENILSDQEKVLITGGGAHNNLLINRFRSRMPKIEFIIPKKEIVDFKEGIIFAFLGYLRTNQMKNISSFVTGSKFASVSGHSIIAKFD
jgi:anhydro-N-acetylmuramic acid kinase